MVPQYQYSYLFIIFDLESIKKKKDERKINIHMTRRHTAHAASFAIYDYYDYHT